MLKNRYSDDFTIELIGSDIITLNSNDGEVVFEAGTSYETSADDGTFGAMTGNIQFGGTAVFQERVSFNKSMAAEGNSFLRGSQVRLGGKGDIESISTIELYPVGGVGGTPVHIEGGLNVEGDLTVEGAISGDISGTDVTFAGDFNIDVTGDISMTANLDGSEYPAITGGDITLESTWHGAKLYMHSGHAGFHCGTGGGGIFLYPDGAIMLRGLGDADNEGGSEWARMRVKNSGSAAFSFEAEWEADSGDGASRYIADIYNQSTVGGNHRCLRLALAGDGDNGVSEASTLSPLHSWPDTGGPGGSDEAHQDYYLVCSDEVSDITDSGAMRFYIDGLGNIGQTFTGQHWVVYKQINDEDMGGNEYIGKIAYSSGEIFNKPDINEALPVIKLCDTERDPRVYGVMTVLPRLALGARQFFEFGKPYHESSRGDMKKDRSTYSPDSLYHKARVNSIGEGQVWVTNYNGEVSNGDYITSSAVAGFGMRQDDDILHNYTVAKCVEEIGWDSIDSIVDHEGTEYKKYLTACTYHCG